MDIASTYSAKADERDALYGGVGTIGRWGHLISAIEQLASARTIEEVIAILRDCARRIVDADGIAVILKDGVSCYYVAEDACAPLWTGKRFPAESCVSGHAMKDRRTIVIPDIELDSRVPLAAYLPTFVRSMVMVPIGQPQAVAAVGAYWAKRRAPENAEIARLEALARSAATALENARLIRSLEEANDTLEERVAQRTDELEQTHEKLRQTQKLETIGKLTGNVAHDFNNLLTPIIGSVELVMHRAALDERSSAMLLRAMDAAERAQLLVQRLLSFARRQPLRPIALDLAGLIADVADLVTSTLGPRVALDIAVAENLPYVLADRNQLELAILNLAVNARDAMPDGGRIEIAAMAFDRRQHPARDVPEGDFVMLSVRDTGIGMDQATAAQAIEPFFSTKGAGEGTGLGLSMVEGLTAQLGGHLSIASAPGEGTAVTMFLPQAGIPFRTVAQSGERDLPVRRNRGTILLIDDDELVRGGTADMLSELGFSVIEATSADQGLNMIAGQQDLSAVVTDHLMPGMTGAELARKLRQDYPRLPVLLISGYQHIETIAPDTPRLSKPFRHKQLGASIAALLDAQHGN